MAQHVEKFAVVAPKNTAQINSLLTAVTFPPGNITAIKVKIPSGHMRKTGLQVFYGQQQVIPRTLNQYLRGNKVAHRFEFDDPFAGGQGWFTDVFNTGRYNHTFELFLDIDDVVTAVIDLPPVLLLRQSDEALPVTTTDGAAVGPAPGAGGGVLRT